MKLLSNIVNRVVYGPLPKPFVAVAEPPIDFISPAAMAPVVADYRTDKSGWRINHLPLVVGQLRPETMDALTGTATDPDIKFSNGLAKPDFETCARQITRGLRRGVESEALQQDSMNRNLVALWAGVAQAILAQDRAWFGAPTVGSFILNREVIRPPQPHDKGNGRFTYAGKWHRDALTDENGAVSRLYLIRMRLPMRMLPNRFTEGFKDVKDGDNKGDVVDPRLPALAARAARRAQSGQIILVNGGHDFGSVHAAYVPKPGEGGPSCFIAVNCVM